MSRTVVRKVDDRAVFVSTLPLRGPPGPMGDVTPAALSAKAAAESAASSADAARIAAETAKTDAQAAAASAPSSTSLADKTDAAKGAALIGYKGASVADQLNLAARRPAAVFAKLFASASGVAALKIVTHGDSLASLKMQQVMAVLDRRIGALNTSGVNTAGTVAGAGSFAAGSDLNGSTTTGTVTVESARYDLWPTGNVSLLAAGSSQLYVQGGVSPTFTKVQVFYIKEPGAGTLGLDIGATVNAATANAANATTILGVLEFTQARGQAAVKLTATGGPVRILFAHRLDSTVSGVDWYNAFNTGGLLLANAVGSGVTIYQAAVAQIAPDLSTFEMDDEFGTDAPSQAAFGTWATMLGAASPLGSKLVIGSTPRASNDAGKLASSAWLRGQVAAKNASWLFFDSYYLLGTYADMNALFPGGDGVHPPAAAEAYATEVMLAALGLGGPNLGLSPRAVNDPSTPSKLASGSKFTKQNAGADLGVFGDSNGFDWWFDLGTANRAIGFGGSSIANCVAVFSKNAAVNPNVLPIGVDFNSAGNVRKMDISMATGVEFTRLRKTDNPGGGLMHLNMGLIRNSFTRTELLAINANSNKGAIAFCSDCTGGAQWVFANGSSTTDWVTVDGKTAI